MKWIDWDLLDEPGRSAALARPAQARAAELREGTARIIAAVRARGDEALRELSAKYDRCALAGLEVAEDEFVDAEAALDPALKAAIREAAGRIEAFHRAAAPQAMGVDTAPGVRVERMLRAIQRVGLYVPAGSAPLPSTALMLGVPARIAGCREVVLCSPARADGRCDAAVLYAARLTGVHKVFKLGGAQAIAAMAYGTASVPKCDKLFGPGNAWVTEAKLQVSSEPDGAAIDMPAGPSEVLVIADAQANPVHVAADLLSQAEHGPDSQVILVSEYAAVLDRAQMEVERQCAGLPRAEIARQALAQSRLISVSSLAQAVEVSNRYAPEHLILQVAAPRSLLDGIESAGSVFLGAWTPESVGDYCSGSNHVLPTYGHARSHSGVSVASYLKQITVQEVSADGLRGIGPCTATLAAAEQLEAHRRAVTLRLAELESMS
ncbi:MAG: histidinol dehydrogenase [Rhodanobacter sp. 68-29]|uniref:histidinol dehydrogenase n=1 Tax=Rhodanobacter sp. PCA2 TaxID=2006117 RepID=UPI00086E74C3|nr:histidinol dehydrogenase [Rhodanobacter sp. PCA2]MBA2078190.1 histidinol dehydrogenase [Rhodanobacter sp. PCA2]MBN8923261.1 histidinol dehydrogenase [Rhodanobacter sp.]ODU75162.1 MAG: histidinol dehydrogenase [Rhodanobacter sp. SCN 69-32]OJY59535.1 MAG: histidinol dehydrogenase [Rhodanobacter sp. 68-29]